MPCSEFDCASVQVGVSICDYGPLYKLVSPRMLESFDGEKRSTFSGH